MLRQDIQKGAYIFDCDNFECKFSQFRKVNSQVQPWREENLTIYDQPNDSLDIFSEQNHQISRYQSLNFALKKSSSNPSLLQSQSNGYQKKQDDRQGEIDEHGRLKDNFGIETTFNQINSFLAEKRNKSINMFQKDKCIINTLEHLLWKSRNIALQIIKRLEELDDKNLLQTDNPQTQIVKGIKEYTDPQSEFITGYNSLSNLGQISNSLVIQDGKKLMTLSKIKEKVINNCYIHSQQMLKNYQQLFSILYQNTKSNVILNQQKQSEKIYLSELWISFLKYFTFRRILFDRSRQEQIVKFLEIPDEDIVQEKKEITQKQVFERIKAQNLMQENTYHLQSQTFNNQIYMDGSLTSNINIHQHENQTSHKLDSQQISIENEVDQGVYQIIRIIKIVLGNIFKLQLDLNNYSTNQIREFIFNRLLLPQQYVNIKKPLQKTLNYLLSHELFVEKLFPKLKQYMPKLDCELNFCKIIHGGQLIRLIKGKTMEPWEWWERSECLRQKVKDSNIKNFNIKDGRAYFFQTKDTDGEDLVIIDIDQDRSITQLPDLEEANCWIKPLIMNGHYFLGLFAKKDINIYESLSLNHQENFHNSWDKPKINNLQQKTQEFSYLQLSETIFKASISSDFPLPKTQFKCLQKESCPPWVKVWANHILSDIECLSDQHQEELKLKLQFSLSKILNYINKSQNYQPPLKITLDEEVYKMIWNSWDEPLSNYTEKSILQEVIHIFKKHSSIQQVSESIALIENTYLFIQHINTKERLLISRLMLLVISFRLLKIAQENTQFNLQGLSIMLLFLSFTHTYFSPNLFKGIHGQQYVSGELSSPQQFERASKFCKKSYQYLYTPQFLWGETVAWTKNHLASPQASMAQERRGILCYPSFIKSFDHGRIEFPWGCKTLKEYTKTILEKQGSWAPDIQKWSYKNSHNVFGTVFFESVISKDKLPQGFIRGIFDRLDDLNQLLEYFFIVEERFGSTKGQISQDYLNNLVYAYENGKLKQRKIKLAKERDSQFEQLMFSQNISSQHTNSNVANDSSYGQEPMKKVKLNIQDACAK